MPWTFAASELQHSPFASISDCSHCVYFNNFTKDPNPEKYGQLCVLGNDDTGCLQDDHKFRECSRHALLLLKIQHRIYSFLVQFCQEILSDVFKNGQLTFLEYTILPEPSITDCRPNSQGYTTMTDFNLLAPYRGRSLIGFNKLHDHVVTLLDAARDHHWSLREDPSYFMDELKTIIQHQPFWIRDKKGDRNLVFEACAEHPLFHLLTAKHAIVQAYHTIGILHLMVERLHILKSLFQDGVVHDLNKGFDTVSSFLYLSRTLCSTMIRKFRTDTWSAPNTRHFYMTIECCEHTRIECKCHAKQPEKYVPRPQQLNRNEEELLWIFFLFEDDAHFCHKHSFHHLSLALEKLDFLIKTDKNIRHMISPPISEKMGILSVTLECIRQLYLWLDHPEVRFFKNKCFQDSDHDIKPDPQWTKTFKWVEHLSDYEFPVPSLDPLSKYPIHNTRSLHNISTVRNAEQFLDELWSGIDNFLEAKTGVAQSPHISQCLEGVMRRTPPFVVPEQQANSAEDEYVPLSRQIHDKEKQITGSFSKLAISEKCKEKTRGDAAVRVEEDVDNPPAINKPTDTVKKFVLRRRPYQVFKTMFGLYGSDPGSCPKWIKWPEFIHAMTCVGFSIEKLQGSAWQFTPGKESDVTRGIQFHEPHPDPDIPYSMARHFGRRLERVYGWTQDMFELE